jgi:uncharacterized protein YajQ (UPF0234 family)
MGNVKELRQEEIDSAIEDYNDEISLDYGWKDAKSVDTLKKAKVRLVSKLSASGLDLDQIEEIVDGNCV